MISYTYNGNEFTKTPDESDIALVAKIESSNSHIGIPPIECQLAVKAAEMINTE